MKITRIPLQKLHNEEWFGFYADLRALIIKFGPDALMILALFTLLIPILDEADKVLVVLRKSAFTKKMKVADEQRDKIFKALVSIVKGFQVQSNPTKADAAERLYIVLNQYKKSVLKGNYTEESSAIYNLLQDLQGKCVADVALLALGEWVTSLKNAEDDFEAARSQRFEESFDKPVEKMKELRNQGDAYYAGIVNILEAKLLGDGLGGDVVVDPEDLKGGVYESDVPSYLRGNVTYNFVLEWNEIVKKYRDFLNVRAGRRAKHEDPEIEVPE
jgi:hypothetical protein